MADRLPLGVGIAGLLLTGLLAPAEAVPLPIELRWLAAYLLFVVLPGWLLVRLVLPPRKGAVVETAVLSVAAGYGVAVLLGLALHVLFRPIAPWQIAAGGGLLVGVLAVLTVGRKASCPPLTPQPMFAPCSGWKVRGLLPVLLILAVAAPLRLADLGWSEFQGDEARVVLRAMAALQGADGALAAHRKVPGEILVAYLFAGSLGQIVEQIARLPYALSGVGAVLAFYSLARLLVGGPAALVAGLLLAVNGYFVAFGRILQYDSLAFFLGIAGLICCYRFGRTEEPTAAPDSEAARPAPVAWAFLGALLLSGSALVALGAIFLVLPALLLAWPGLVRHHRSWRVLVAWGWPVVPALIAAMLVFGASDPSAGPSGVWSYLGPRFGGDRPYWHADAFLYSANHYLSSPYLLTLLSVGAFALIGGTLDVIRASSRRGIALRLSLAIALAALTWDKPHAALALGALLMLVLVVQAPGHGLYQRLGTRVALVWAAGPLFAHLFLIRVPGTHWREAFPGLILLLAAMVVPALANRRWRLVVGGLLGLLIVGTGHFAWVTLAQRYPEYQIAYPENRHPLDWTNRDGRGIGGVFGTVHRHGWKALGVLMADGTLAGGFTTNESPAIAAWYLRRSPGCAGALDYVFRAPRTPQDRNLAVPVPVPSGYVTRGRVRVEGHSTISIQTPPAVSTPIGDIPAEPYEARFDRELASAWGPIGELYRADLGAAVARRACSP